MIFIFRTTVRFYSVFSYSSASELKCLLHFHVVSILSFFFFFFSLFFSFFWGVGGGGGVFFLLLFFLNETHKH